MEITMFKKEYITFGKSGITKVTGATRDDILNAKKL